MTTDISTDAGIESMRGWIAEEIGSTTGWTTGVAGSTSGSMLKASVLTTGSTPWRQRRGRTVKTGWLIISIVKAIASKPNWTVAVTGLKTVTTMLGDRADRWYDRRGDQINRRFDNRGFFNRWWVGP